MSSELSRSNIERIILASLFLPEELPPNPTKENLPKDAIIVEGIMNEFVFNPKRIEEHREDVKGMLAQLGDEFMKDGGGGMSLMQMVADKHGNLYGEQQTADLLYVLGNALGYADWIVPRSMWAILPGHMPYIVIDLDK